MFIPQLPGNKITHLFSMLFCFFHTFYVLNIRGEGGVEVIGAHLQHSRNCTEARQREGKEKRAIEQSKIKALNRNGHDISTDIIPQLFPSSGGDIMLQLPASAAHSGLID